ncbi:MAG TPA: LAGLIDADG family homing endonuclease, partial [Candidatus Glassbacteria bacterium]|nr:LAGLIDADG family homing endonuclease [Candidatus Glassbacteria bacterium]
MVVINWQTDPLLLDQEPTPMNEWLTANKILESDSYIIDSFIDLETLILNLYPILVRKIDFVREKDSNRILSRFPFLVLTDEEITLIKSKILLIAEFARDYFYKSTNSGIMEWKRRLQTYLKRGAMPYPLYRCACTILDFPMTNPNIEELFFESARGKRYSIPTRLTNTLAYLCGVANGDGHLHRHSFRVTDETKEFMSLLSKLYEQMFNDTGEIFQNENAWNVELRSSAVVRIINFLTDQTIEGAKYDSLREPLLFKQLGAPFRNIYWRGAMDADGSFKNQITFTSASERFVLDFKIFLDSLNMDCTIQQKPSGPFSLYLYAKEKLQYVELIGSLNPKKSDDLLDYLQKKRSYVTFIGLKKGVLTKEGYFNLDLLDTLFIIGLGDILKDYRNNQSYLIMDEQFEIAQGSYSNMERNERGLPYFMLKTIIRNQRKDESIIYDMLMKNFDHIRYNVAGSGSLKLPLKPNEKLENILSF